MKNYLKEGDEKAIKLNDMVNGLMQDATQNGWISPAAVYQFFPAQSDGDTVLIYDPENPGKIIETFEFPRQESDPYLCLADFLKSVDSGQMDYVCILCRHSWKRHSANS